MKRCDFVSETKLEDLITCPIHLGMMEDPRILPCGHAFCLNCLHGCVSRICGDTNVFSCPVCRRHIRIDVDNLKQLPPSLATKQLTDYVVETKSRICVKRYINADGRSNESIPGSFSLEHKRELVKHLLREIGEYTKDKTKNPDNYTQQLENIINCIETPSIPNHDSVENAVVNSTNGIELFNSNYELMDVETIRENMKKFSEYKLQRDINNALQLNSIYQESGKLIMADIKVNNNEPDVTIWISERTNTVMLKTMDLVNRTFNIHIESSILKPIYVKLHDNCLFVSGFVCMNDDKLFKYCLVQCSMFGSIIKRAQFNSTYETTQINISGFHIDTCSGKIFVCLPLQCRIAVLNLANLMETNQSYHFSDIHPAFVTRNPETAEIWASCPHDGRIIIIDEITGSYRQLGTNQIYNAIPSHIIVTNDHRVLFLDSHLNRVFWVRKRNEFILIQRLAFSGHQNKQLNGKISGMVSVPGTDPIGKLLFCTSNRMCIVRPTKPMNGESNKHLLCNIL